MAPKGKQPPRSAISRGLEHTFHPAKSTVLQQLLIRTPGTDARAKARALVLRILDGPCTEKLKASGPMAGVTLVKANGHINSNLHGAWVFSYDQRMSNSKWDELTVLCRGLLVLFPRTALLAEGFPMMELQPGVPLHRNQNALLRQLCTSNANHPCCIIEPMAKFWEGGYGSGEISLDDICQACGGVEPQLVRIEEKVDGNLGMLYPQMDDDFNPVFDALPLLCTKGCAHSPDIERQTRMLSELYPAMRLSLDVSHVIVEVVDVEMKVVVPYEEQHTGARLIAAHAGEYWLSQDATDELARSWSMPRPQSRPLPEQKTLESVKRLATDYTPAPGEVVDEGFVVHLTSPPLAETIRIKVHTHFWDIVHDWWEGRISVCSVMPALRDRRFAESIAVIEPCLVKYKGSGTRRHRDDFLVKKFRAALVLARRSLDDSLAAWAEVLADTASVPKGPDIKRRLDEAVAARLELSKEQRDCLCLGVMRIRSDKDLGLHGAVDPQLVARFPVILHRVFGEANAPEAGLDDVALVTHMSQESWSHVGRRVIEAWATVAQKQWDMEMMDTMLDAAPAAGFQGPEVALDDCMVPVQCLGEPGRDHLKQYISERFLASQIMEQIDGDGYIVLPGILSSQEADEELARAWGFIETVSPGVKRDDRDTWWAAGDAPDPWPSAQRDMFQLHQAGWLFSELREKLAVRVFEPLYGTAALHCSKDGFTFQRPTDRDQLRRTPNDHFDQGMRWMGLQCIQGSVALTDQSSNDGCFQVWPGSWRLRERLLCGRPPARGREDFLILSDQERQFLQHHDIQPRRVPVKKGDVILWRSDVAHCGGPPLGRCDSYRLVAYICCLPAALTPEGVYEQKQIAYEQLETGGHWTNREEWFKARSNHQCISWQKYFDKPPDLTVRQRQLYGLDRYESQAQGEICPVCQGSRQLLADACPLCSD
mmetsp:Transcript_100533/g.174553  ORF Transcript_100533/g.174553 Transcript_100533/m.174553 type:complete len:936 (+) Transcript_100533:57-2864(+)